MIRFRHALFVAAVFVFAAGPATAQTTDASSTPPPKAPTYPKPAKPDFSSLRFLLGKWTCVSYSERRGSEPTKGTLVTTMTPDGYWMKTVTTSAGVSYAKFPSTYTDLVTYDGTAKRWIDIGTGSYGAYGYSTSTGMDSYGHMLWGADSFLYDGDTTSSTGTLVTKVSDTKYTTASAFTTTAGLVNRVHGTCTKG